MAGLAGLTWLGLAWLVLTAAATPATTPGEANTTTPARLRRAGAALRAANVVVFASPGVVAGVAAAVNKPSQAEPRRAKSDQPAEPSQGIPSVVFCVKMHAFCKIWHEIGRGGSVFHENWSRKIRTELWKHFRHLPDSRNPIFHRKWALMGKWALILKLPVVSLLSL